jgi:hypothetical protein
MVYRESTTPSPRHLIERLSTCPTYMAAYVARHMDTIGKLLNHLLCFMLLCDVLVFLASWNVSFLPALGFNTVLLSFLLCVQTISVGLILNSSSHNNHRISALSCLSPTTEFTVGIAFGITVGAAILAFVLSSTYRGQCKSSYQQHAPAYRHLIEVTSKETSNDSYNNSASGDHDVDGNPNDYGHRYHQSSYYEQNTTATTPTTSYSSTGGQQKSLNYYDDYPVGNYACLEKRGSVNAIWFWSGLLVWLNFALCLLLAIGRAELASQSLSLSNSSYEEVGTVDDDNQDAFRRGASTSTSTTFPGDMPIHGGGGMNGTSVSSFSSSPSLGGAAYTGDYSSVPEIRGDGLPKR